MFYNAYKSFLRFLKEKGLHTNVAYTAIRNQLLYSGFVLLNVHIFFLQNISFSTFGVIIDDFFTSYPGLGYSLHAFLEKQRGYWYRLRPCVSPSVMLSPLKPFDEIQPNLVCELLT